MEKPTVSDMMVAYAQDAVDHAKASCGIELDYSPQSVQQVETVLEQLYEALPRGFLARLLRWGPSAEDIWIMSKMYGGYVGEVLRRANGGEWAVDTEIAPGEQVIALAKGDGRAYPPSKVQKRLMNGSEDNVWVYFQWLMDEQW